MKFDSFQWIFDKILLNNIQNDIPPDDVQYGYVGFAFGLER
jgi:hypothetical protein